MENISCGARGDAKPSGVIPKGNKTTILQPVLDNGTTGGRALAVSWRVEWYLVIRRGVPRGPRRRIFLFNLPTFGMGEQRKSLEPPQFGKLWSWKLFSRLDPRFGRLVLLYREA